MSHYTPYTNGPFFNLISFILELLKFWKWNKMKRSWILFSLKEYKRRNFDRFSYPHAEFKYMISKYKNRSEWLENEGLKKIKK